MLVTYHRDGFERTLILGTERAEWPDWQPIPPPRRADYNNAAAYCKAGGANAYGKCIARN
jgi:hypothetical protein